VRKLRTTLMTVTATTYYRVVRDTRNKCASWLVFSSSCRVCPLYQSSITPGFFFSVDGMDGICICRQDRQIRSPRAPPARPTRHTPQSVLPLAPSIWQTCFFPLPKISKLCNNNST
jgi:hypothetical protein